MKKITLLFFLMNIQTFIMAQKVDHLIGVSLGIAQSSTVQNRKDFYKGPIEVPDLQINYLKSINQRLYLILGVGFGQVGGKYEYVYYTSKFHDFTYMTTSQKKETIIRSNIIKIPIGLRYSNFGNKKLTPVFQATISCDIPTGEPHVIVEGGQRYFGFGFPKSNVKQTKHESTFLFSARIDAGLAGISDYLIFEPKLFFAHSISKFYPNTNYYLLGFSLTFNFNFFEK